MQQAMTEAEARSVVVNRRIREGNIVPFRDKSGNVVTAEQQAVDPRRGYVLGLMLLDGTITARQHEAGLRFAEDEARYYGLSGIPFPSPRAQDLFSVHGSTGEENEGRVERAKKARARHKDMEAVLQATGSISEGRRVSGAVKEVALLDNPYARNWPAHMLHYIRRGLNRLADHYAIPQGGGCDLDATGRPPYLCHRN